MASGLNIIYLVVHDLGRTLGCYGRPVQSPNLDALARESMQFDRAFCTAPACSPSRICAMTGQYPQTSGGYGLAHMGWPLAPEVFTVVDYLNAGGYETVHCGLNHERHAQHNRYQLDLELSWEDYRIENAVCRAMQYLESRPRSTPLYLNIGTQDVHAVTWGPLTKEQAEARYGRKVDLDAAYIPPHLPDNEHTRLFMAKFQACIANADEQVGQFIAALKRLGYWDTSLVLFTTDHGIAGTRAKGTLYDRGTEIALLAHLPGGQHAGRRVQELIPNIDVAPTVLEAAGLPLPQAMQGRSFWPLLSGGAYTANQQLFQVRNFHGERVSHRPDYSDWWDPGRAIRTERFKYIRNFSVRPRHWMPSDAPELWGLERNDMVNWPLGDRPNEELYDLAADPEEHTNLATLPEHAQLKQTLRTQLTHWMRDVDDPVLRGEVPIRPEKPGWGENWPVRRRS